MPKANKNAYNELSEDKKVAAIDEYKRCKSYRAVGLKFGVSHNTVRNWVNSEESHRDYVQRNNNMAAKRVSRLSGDRAELDSRVFNWFAAARAHHVPVSGPTLRHAALKVAKDLALDAFVASSGWLDSFCKRHCISFRTLSGESAGIDHAVVRNWKQCLPHLLDGYDLKDIWNIDETGLFWKGLPTRSMVQKSEEAKGGKLARQRLTVCLLCSAQGEKFMPLVIGNAAYPRAFKNKLPKGVYWDSNTKAWMTGEKFLAYLQKFNMAMENQNRKVALLLDNAPCHPEVQLSAVKLVFLPPNTTAGTQPLDAGIIKNFKVHYRDMLLSHLYCLVLSSPASIDDMIKTVNVKMAIDWVVSAWDSVHPGTIQKCFAHAGVEQTSSEEEHLAEDDRERLLQITAAIGIVDVVEEDISVSSYDTSNQSWESAVLYPKDGTETSNAEEEDSEELPEMPSIAEVMRSLTILRDYNFHKLNDDVGNALTALEKAVITERMRSAKNSTLDNFVIMGAY